MLLGRRRLRIREQRFGSSMSWDMFGPWCGECADEVSGGGKRAPVGEHALDLDGRAMRGSSDEFVDVDLIEVFRQSGGAGQVEPTIGDRSEDHGKAARRSRHVETLARLALRKVKGDHAVLEH